MTAAYLKWLKAANAAFVAAGYPSLFAMERKELPDALDAVGEYEITATEADQLLKLAGLGGWPPEKEVAG